MKIVLLCIVVVLVFIASGSAGAESWIAYQDRFGFSSISFGLEADGNLWVSPNATIVPETLYGYNVEYRGLRSSGSWAVCGQVTNGVFTADPYASFIQTGTFDDSCVIGYIGWKANTPIGHTTNLLLGVPFVGNGGITIDSVSNTSLYIHESITYYRNFDGYSQTSYSSDDWPVSHPFTATFDGTGTIVPEPSSLLALLGGIGSIGGIVLRSKRKERRT